MQLDKIGRFVKVLFDNFSYNSSQQNLVAFWAVLKNITFSVETAVTTFWVTFGNLGYSFITTSGHTACYYCHKITTTAVVVIKLFFGGNLDNLFPDFPPKLKEQK